MNYLEYKSMHPEGGLVKAWTKGVPVEEAARSQLDNIARLPFIHKWVAAMPDVHMGIGATVGSVIPTHKAIIPAAVGVDIGCGMMAARTTLTAEQLPDNLKKVRSVIERTVPTGMASNQSAGHTKGGFTTPPNLAFNRWRKELRDGFEALLERFPVIEKSNNINQLGSLGGGNHFIEVCLDEDDRVWFMLHSGSRGVGNLIGRTFIELAKKDMGRHIHNLPDKDLAYFEEGSLHFNDYVEAVHWAQDFARINREVMMERIVRALGESGLLPAFQSRAEVVNCHHNYVEKEHHFGADVWVTRKGAVRARTGDMGIIPGSMGARSYIVRGKGNADSFHSCSHGAGRTMSRSKAKKTFSLDDHKKATAGVECKKDHSVIDETPGAYKDIDRVMAAQSDLVEIVHTLRQVVCVKG